MPAAGVALAGVVARVPARAGVVARVGRGVVARVV